MRRGTEAVVFFSVCKKEGGERVYILQRYGLAPSRRESERVWAGGEQAEWLSGSESARESRQGQQSGL